MRTCVCGLQHDDDVHFCSCGEFLAFDNPPDAAGENGGATTRVLPAVRKAAAEQRVDVLLFLEGQDVEEGVEPTITVPAGGRVHLIARVRNQSDIVDSYDLHVEGMPRGWWTVEPSTSYLMPRGSTERFEEDVVVALHPPRTPQAEARRWPVAVVATSQADPHRRGLGQAGVDIGEFRALGVEARPETVTGTRRARFAGVVENRSNMPLPVTLDVADGEERCDFDILKRHATLDPGERRAIDVVARPQKIHWIGRRIEHRLAVTAAVAETEEAEPLRSTVPALFRQRPVIAWWVPLLLLLLVIAAIILWLLWPDRTRVPEVRQSRSAFNAQKRLERKGLKLDPDVKTVRARRGVRPGTVIDQAPKPGTEVDKGKTIGIVVVAGRTKLKVPKVTGLKIARAEERLQNAGFTLGAVTPAVDPKARIKSQVPIENVLRRRGTPVNVVLGDRKPAAAEKKEPETKAAAAGGGPVPEVAGATAAAAAAELRAAGLTPKIEFRIDPAKRGTVLETVPPEGADPPPDGVVRLIVSAGFPRLAYDNGRGAQVVGGVAGRPILGVARNGFVATGGAWTPDGVRVAYATRGRLFLAKPGSAARPRRIAVPSGRTVVHPAFARLERRSILAFVDRNDAGGDEVCWTDLTRRRATRPSCRELPGWTVDGLSWHPDGTELLAAASGGGEFGMLRLTSKSAFSSDARQWKAATKLATPADGDRGVLAAAFSPVDGDRLAVVTNLETGDFRLALAAADELAELEDPEFLPLSGCDVAWRPDGKELAVVQSGSLCDTRIGPIVRVRPADPRTVQTIVLMGQHPAWQPIDFTPEPER
jgi:beta-lactam-binding protein with PASTA domain